MKKWLTSCFLSIMTTLSYAGNGSSGGGNIYGDQLNPWYLSNTESVTYCLEVAPEFSDIPEEKLGPMIDEALGYWKRTFSRNEAMWEIGDTKADLRLGTQSFVRQEACAPETDIRFQFGFLTEGQRAAWPGHRQLIAGAFRTSYDEVRLRAKGVIYVAPEQGPLRPRSRKLHAKPWSFGNHGALRLTLIHELGHVFGLQDDHYSGYGLMSARFVERNAERESVEAVSERYVSAVPSPLGCNEHLDAEFDVISELALNPGRTVPGIVQKAETGIEEVLGLPESYEMHVVTRNRETKFYLFGKEFAKIVYPLWEPFLGDTEEAISLYLSENQKVFPGIAPDDFDVAHMMYSTQRSGRIEGVVLELATGLRLPAFVNFDQRCYPEVAVTYEGKKYHGILP
jgi:hypothetical protein